MIAHYNHAVRIKIRCAGCMWDLRVELENESVRLFPK